MPAEDGANKPLSVSEAMAIAKTALESCTLTLVGEVSEFSNKPGYKAVYFTVKDEGASLPAMMWMNRFHASGVDLRVGALVQMTGRFTLYAPKGRMNFDVFSLSLAGEGDLRQKVANLARKLDAEGLMDPSRKRPLPAYPDTVGLVTSPRGAAVHDVLRTMRRRYPSARILLAGVPVEGSLAPSLLSEALRTVAEAGAEVVLLVRGGGSFEDLMPFNDETLARTIASLPVPVVTGIGHEPDTSIADMVADLRASTPTAAAESVAPDALELDASLAATQASITRTLLGRLERSASVLDGLASRPVLADGHSLFSTEALTLDLTQDRLHRAIPSNLARDAALLESLAASLQMRGPAITGARASKAESLAKRLEVAGNNIVSPFAHRMSAAASRLDDLSPLSVLGRGFSLTRDEKGALVQTVGQVNTGDKLQVTVSDGTIACTVDGTTYADRELLSWKENR